MRGGLPLEEPSITVEVSQRNTEKFSPHRRWIHGHVLQVPSTFHSLVVMGIVLVERADACNQRDETQVKFNYRLNVKAEKTTDQSNWLHGNQNQ